MLPEAAPFMGDSLQPRQAKPAPSHAPTTLSMTCGARRWGHAVGRGAARKAARGRWAHAVGQGGPGASPAPHLSMYLRVSHHAARADLRRVQARASPVLFDRQHNVHTCSRLGTSRGRHVAGARCAACSSQDVC